MSPETTTADRESMMTDRALRDRMGRDAAAPLSGAVSAPLSGPLSGLERAAFFAALRRKADQRLAEFG